MEKSNSLSLDKFLEKRPEKRVTEPEAAKILYQICEALRYLHSIGISHRDIKLGNVLISDRLKVELIDFGFATMSGNQLLTSFCGTPCYMCPEILKKQPYSGFHADVWATGILLYRLVVGCPPFKGNRSLKQAKTQTSRTISLRASSRCLTGSARPSNSFSFICSKWTLQNGPLLMMS